MLNTASFVDGLGRSDMHGIADALDAGIVGVDEQLRITAWNRWMEDTTGQSAKTAIGRSLGDVVPGLRTSAITALHRAIGGATVVMSHRLHGYFIDLPTEHPAFDRMQQSARILPLADDRRGRRGAVAIIHDVTERVARENELRDAMELAQQANRAKSEFLAAMSHELRTPIGAMTGYAELLAEGIYGPVSDTQRTQLARIKTVGGHLLSIVEEILSLARLEAGREVLRCTAVDAANIVREAVIAVEPLVTAKGLSLDVHLPQQAVEMHTDAVKVRQILINLLGNATKFTDCGGISVAVSTTDAGPVAFSIQDTGPGISEADQSRFFEPFVQAGKPGTGGGTGLGLAVSRNLARLLGGDLAVESTVGIGSIFTATLPRTAGR